MSAAEGHRDRLWRREAERGEEPQRKGIRRNRSKQFGNIIKERLINMNKMNALVLSGFLMVGLSVSKVLAKSWDFYGGGNLGALAPDQGTLSPGLIGGGEVGVAKDFYGFSIGGMYYKSKLNGGADADPKIGITPISFTPYVQHTFEKTPVLNLPITLKLGGGLSYCAVSYDKNTDDTTNNSTISSRIQSSQKVDSSLGYHFKSGFDIHLTKNISIGTDISYLWLNPKQAQSSSTLITNVGNSDVILGGVKTLKPGESTTISSSSTGDLQLSSWIIFTSIKYHF